MARKDALLNMRQILIKRRDALRQALAGDLSLLKELRAQTAGDLVDAALDSAQDEISSQLAEVESRELASVENALERMRNGHYGVCEGCAIKIPMARLNALTVCNVLHRLSARNGEVRIGWRRRPRLGSADRFRRRVGSDARRCRDRCVVIQGRSARVDDPFSSSKSTFCPTICVSSRICHTYLWQLQAVDLSSVLC